ncbi:MULTISPECIES: CopG family ribbon-helix-helix protein [Burkholderiaceae]|jgi:predicted transcriptional regulator|nr:MULTISPECIES: ribbon-helix-helix protein, CopG family [Burkholderiaceae]AME22715.1 CopG family transcriptional regulator [Burkholderia sp. PAMC 26561]
MPRTMTAHVEDALAERVDELAKRLDRPRGWLISKALEQFVELEDTRDRLTREGIASLRAGKSVPHEDVRAWAESLSTKKPLSFPKEKRGA